VNLLRACTVVALLAIGVAPRPAAALDWLSYRSIAGGFTLLLCGDPADLVRHPLEGVVTHFVLARTGDMSCIASYTDYPDDYVLHPDDELIATRNGLVLGAGGTLMASRSLQYAAGPGRSLPALEFVATSGRLTSRGVLAFVGRRLYTWTIIAPPDVAQSPDADRFLSSFQLVR